MPQSAGCGASPFNADRTGTEAAYHPLGVHSDPRGATQLQHPGNSGSQGGPATHWLPSAMTEFAIFGGVDHRGTVGKVAPGLFAQEGRCCE